MNLRDIYGAIRLFFSIVWRPWTPWTQGRVSILDAVHLAKNVWLKPSTYCAGKRSRASQQLRRETS